MSNYLTQVLLLIVAVAVTTSHCRIIERAVNNFVPESSAMLASGESKQLTLGPQAKETSTPDFVRLVVMRLIYGLASTMGLEERLEGVLNGVFVPPNADDDLFGFGGGSDDGDYNFGGLDDIFDDGL